MLPLPFAFVFLGFVQHAAVLPTGRRTDLPRLGLRPIALPPPPRRWVPCICCSGGRVGGRVGGRAEDADSKPVSQSKERGAPWHPVQKAAAVLVPAVVLAAACVFCVPSQWQQMDSPHAQQVPVCEASFNRLVIKPDWFKDSEAKLEVKDSEAKLEALGRASSSAGYPGSRGDVAAAKRYYTKDDNNQLISELAMICLKEGVNHNVESAKWTYPGWRADTAKVFDTPLTGRTTTPLDVQTAVKSMDRKHGLHEKLPPSVFSSAWTSFRSDVDYAFRFTDRHGDVSSVIFTFGPTLALSTWFLLSTDSTLSKLGCDTSWRKWEVQGCALAATGILALTASSSIGFLPLVFAGTYCGLQAVSLHEEDTP